MVVVPARDALLSTEVVVGVDGGPHSDSALGYAFEMADLHDMPVRAIHAPAESESDPPGPTHVGVLDRALATWSDRYPDVKVIAESVPGHPVRVLSECARSARLLLHRGLGRSYNLIPVFTAAENVDLPLLLIGPRPSRPGHGSPCSWSRSG